MSLLAPVKINLPGPEMVLVKVMLPFAVVGDAPVPLVACMWSTVSDWRLTGALMVAATARVGRMAPGKGAKGPVVAPLPLRLTVFPPKAYVPLLITSTGPRALMVKLEAVGGAAMDMRVRPPLILVAPV